MRVASMLLTLLITACANAPAPQQATVSPCAESEASYACQVERYHNVNVP